VNPVGLTIHRLSLAVLTRLSDGEERLTWNEDIVTKNRMYGEERLTCGAIPHPNPNPNPKRLTCGAIPHPSSAICSGCHRIGIIVAP